jgi:hypothetical protein
LRSWLERFWYERFTRLRAPGLAFGLSFWSQRFEASFGAARYLFVLFVGRILYRRGSTLVGCL